MLFKDILPFLKEGKFVTRKQMDWVYNDERIRLNGYKIELYDKHGYVSDKILWRDDLDADDWELYDDVEG